MNARRGQRIRLAYTSDPYTDLPAGSEGTIQFIDDLGTVHVAWDCGEALGLIPGEDKWETIVENTPNSRDVHL